MTDPDLYPVPPEWARRARMSRAAYDRARTAARETPDACWSEQARRLDWMTPPTRIKDVSFDRADFRIRWFEDGMLNVASTAIWPDAGFRSRSSGRAMSRPCPAG